MAKRHITQEKAIAVADWLRSKQQWIEDAGIESLDINAIISKDLGFPIANSTIMRLAQSLGIQFRRSDAAPSKDDRMTLLTHAVAELFDRLGEPRPEPLAVLLNGDNHRDQPTNHK